MRLDDQNESSNVEDRRGSGFGGGGGLRIGRGGLSLGTIVVAFAASYFLGIDPMLVLGMLAGDGGSPVQQQQPVDTPTRRTPAEDEMGRFVGKVLGSTEDTWSQIFREHNARYRDPKLVLFSGATPTACGTGQSAMGPFYCPLDQKVYLDTSFFRDLKERFRAPGEFAQAYVIAPGTAGRLFRRSVGKSRRCRQAHHRTG